MILFMAGLRYLNNKLHPKNEKMEEVGNLIKASTVYFPLTINCVGLTEK